MTAPGYTYRIPSTDPTDVGNQPGFGPFRAGGTAAPLPSGEPDLPSSLSLVAKRQAPAVELLRDLWLGTERVRDQRTKYLPQAPGEDSVNYDIRVKRSVLFNILRHTVEVLVGFVFRKDPDLGDDVPPKIVEDWENIDLAGTHGDVFTRQVMQDALAVGHAAILVEYPDTGGQRLTLADEEPLRPYWVPIKKDNILSWRTEVEDGRTVLEQVVLKETQQVANGLFGEREQVRYRVLYRHGGEGTNDVDLPAGSSAPIVGWQLLEVTKANQVALVDEGVYGNQVEIPLVEVPTSGRVGLFESEPPLLDLAYLNLAHFQQWSDYATSLHKTCVPILFTAGFQMTDENGHAVVVGPNSGLNSDNPAAKAEYISHTGASLAACKDALDDLMNEMSILGVAMLAVRKRAPETAEAKRIDRGSFDSALGVTARGLQDAIERCFLFHARYYQIDDGGSIKINRDFENMTMQADLLTAYVGAVANAGVPARILLQAMQEGGLIAPDIDLDDLEMKMMANQAAVEQQQKLDRQAQLAAMRPGLPPGEPPPPPIQAEASDHPAQVVPAPQVAPRPVAVTPRTGALLED